MKHYSSKGSVLSSSPDSVTSARHRRRRRVSRAELLIRSRTSLERLFGKHRGQALRFCFSFPFLLLGLCALVCYVFVRIWIRLTTWMAVSHRVRMLRAKLHRATTIQEYQAIAQELDIVTECEEWKKEPRSSCYDWRRVTLWTKALKTYRAAGKIHRVCDVLSTAQHLKFGRTFDEDCYSYSHWGTKYAIEEFHKELLGSLHMISQHISSKQFQQRPCIEVLRFINDFTSRFGRTALYLSGGGMIGFHHFGVGKALLQMDLIPDVLVGCSAGSAVASWLATRTKADAQRELEGELFARLFAPFEQNSVWSKVANFVFLGHMCTKDSWLTCARRIFADMTLAEAHTRTGRVLCLSASRADEQTTESSGAYILNYRSAPDVLLSSAILASCAFPLLSAPYTLLEKTRSGDLVPSTRFFSVPFRDGCLAADIPVSMIMREFDVGFSIVCQVNPHVYPFMVLQSGARAGRPARRRIVRRWSSTLVVLGRMEEFFREVMASIVRLGISLDVWPRVRGMDTNLLFNQTYRGDVTLVPRRVFWTHRLAATNIASHADVLWYLQEGMTMTYEKLSLIRTRMQVERAARALYAEAQRLSVQRSTLASPMTQPSPCCGGLLKNQRLTTCQDVSEYVTDPPERPVTFANIWSESYQRRAGTEGRQSIQDESTKEEMPR